MMDTIINAGANATITIPIQHEEVQSFNPTDVLAAIIIFIVLIKCLIPKKINHE